MKLKAIRALLKKDKVITRVSLIVSIFYGLLYYWSAGFMIFRNGLTADIMVVANPLELMWQMRGPFLWEAISQINLPLIGSLLIAIPNLLIALILTTLVYGNLTLILIGLRYPNHCSLNKKRPGGSLVNLLPALFSGFGCCAPSIIILWVSIFGSVSSVMVVAVRWLLPLGLVLLTIGLISAYKNILTQESKPI